MQSDSNADSSASAKKTSQTTAPNSDKPDKPKTSTFGKILLGVAGAIIIFSIGVNVGDGRLKLHVASENKGLPNKLDFSSVNQVYGLLKDKYDGKLTEQQLSDGLNTGLAEATGDPYTSYFTADQAKKFDEELNGKGFSGIGAELGLDKDKNLIVVAPITGTPAANAGIKPKDMIVEIDGKSTSGLSIDEAVTKIRGKKGSQVKLKIIRNHADTIDLTITRDDITVPTVESKVLDDNIGYMHISTFGADTGDLALQQAKDLADKNVKAVILDLRGNPGGSVDSAVQVASLWVPQGQLVMQEKRLNGQVLDTYKALGNDVLGKLPTIVLVDEGSASASEIVSGALHDTNKAKLYGEKTYGKGVVQEINPLNDGAELKVTVARWYRPNGQNIDKKGINPDTEVKLSDDDAKAGNDTQLKAAQDQLDK
jgi:carboxyl-terminal processing protease